MFDVFFADSAILQGAFLLADKLCLPSNLSSIQKIDWDRVGHPVLEAIREISGPNEDGVPPTTAASWKKKVVCVLWLKLLCTETGDDIEIAWKENPFFSLQSGLPEVNHVVLFEVVKSTAAAQEFSNFLLYLPQSQICAELERLVQHMKSSPTTEVDVRLFLEVWWELWKRGVEEKKEGEDNIETMFARQLACLSSTSSGLSPQAAKRLKLDATDIATPLPTTDVLYILLHALKDIKDHLSTPDLCFQALYICLDALYTSFLIDQVVIHPPKEMMHILSKIASIKERNGENLSPELIQEAQKNLRASHTPSQFQPRVMKLGEALEIITEIAQFWQSCGLLKVSDSSKPSCSAFKLEQSAHRVLTALSESMPKIDVEEGVKSVLQSLLESLSLPAVETTPEFNARVAAIIISHRLDSYQNIAVLFASEKSWADCDEHWIQCLEQNQAAFQQCDTLLNLTSTLMSKLHSEATNVDNCRQLMKVIAGIFSALHLKDKNSALAEMLRLSSKGFFGCSVPSALTDRFGQELNMAFNCIIQGGGVASQGNLNTAVSLVARVAFQNPEAALRSCCHSAIFNKDAFSLMAKILGQLPGLRGQGGRKVESEEKEALSGTVLLCRCLLEIVKTKSLMANEKEQFLKFLGLLMTPAVAVEEEERRQSFLPPQEVVNFFVLPSLSTVGECFKAFMLSTFTKFT